MTRNFREIPYGHANSTPSNLDYAGVEPSEIQNLGTEIGPSLRRPTANLRAKILDFGGFDSGGVLSFEGVEFPGP